MEATIELKIVGKMVIPEMPKGSPKVYPVKDISSDDYCRSVQWPMCLNGGDIARDGKILIRNYECKLNSYFNIS